MGKKTTYSALIVAVLAISTSAILVKLSTAPSSIVAFYRLLFTVVILFLPTIIYYRREITSLSRKDILYSILAGAFLAFHFITWFESLKYTSVASSVVLVTLSPIFAMIGAYIFFKEKVSKYVLAGTILALIGSLIIGWGDFKIGGIALYGDVLALIGAILVTGYWLIGQSLRKNLSLLPYTFIVYSASTVILFIYNIVLREEFLAYDRNEWKVLIALAIIPTIFGHTILNWAIKYVSAVTVSITILAEPIGASILAYLIFGESVSIYQLIGSFTIFAGIIIYFKNQK